MLERRREREGKRGRERRVLERRREREKEIFAKPLSGLS